MDIIHHLESIINNDFNIIKLQGVPHLHENH